MIVDNAFADGEAQAGSVSFTVGGKHFKQLALDLGRDARPPVFDLGNEPRFCSIDTEFDFSALGHGVSSIVDKVIKDPAQSFGIEEQFDLREGSFQFQRDRFEFEFRAKLLDKLLQEKGVIARSQHDSGVRRRLSEFEDLADQIADTIDLFADASPGFQLEPGRNLIHARHFRGNADDVKRVFQVMNNRAGEASEDGQALSLEHFAEVLAIEFAQPVADFTQQG